MKLSGHTILITGGTSGIGLEFARSLVDLGNVVIATGRNPERLAKAKERVPKLHTIASDVSSVDDVQSLRARLLKEFPGLSIVMNNAGIMQELNLNRADLGDEELTREIETNLTGPIRVTQAFLPHLKRQPTAAIVNVTSGLAFVPLPTSPVYCATKAGLHSFTQSLRAQLQHTKVKVFEVAPPATQTPLLVGHDAEAMKGVTVMPVETMVEISLAGLEKDCLEIRPGQSNQLKLMSRVAPEFILKQLSRSVALMLRRSGQANA